MLNDLFQSLKTMLLPWSRFIDRSISRKYLSNLKIQTKRNNSEKNEKFYTLTSTLHFLLHKKSGGAINRSSYYGHYVCNNHWLLCLWTKATSVTFRSFHSGSFYFISFFCSFLMIERIEFFFIRLENIFLAHTNMHIQFTETLLFGVHFWHCTPKAKIFVFRVR